jgi:hypothetical protein
MKASRARVSQSGLKTNGGATAGDVRRVMYVAPSQRSREDQVKDGRVDATGCVRLCYPYFTVFIVLYHRAF